MTDTLFDLALERLRDLRKSPSRKCKVCGGDATSFDIVDFNKCCETPAYLLGLSGIPVIYFLCRQCHFIFTDVFDSFTPDQWRQYVYNEEYEKVDPEYKEMRPRENVRLLSTFLSGRKTTTIGLDYGGGNGATAAAMRQRGWTFDSCDPFGLTEISPGRIGLYNFCSAIEVFEHSPDPIGTLRSIVEKSSPDQLIVMIQTGLSDSIAASEARLAWWYAAPRNGHVSLYSLKSLEILGAGFGLMCTAVRGSPTFLTRGLTRNEARWLVLSGRIRWRLRMGLKI